MPADTLPIPIARSGHTTEPATLSPASVPLTDRLLWARADLASLAGLSTRHLPPLDTSGDIPGRVTGGALGRAVRYQSVIVREWILRSLPCRGEWAADWRRNVRR
jgi:hypothetical protein